MLHKLITYDPIYNRGRLYLERWRIFDNRFFGVYLHCFHMGDQERHLHNHPWTWFCSVILKGSYCEVIGTFRNAGRIAKKANGLWTITKEKILSRSEWIREPGIRFMRGDAYHTISEIEEPGKTWTLFIRGRRVRQWGFWIDETNSFEPWDAYLTKRGIITEQDAAQRKANVVNS